MMVELYFVDDAIDTAVYRNNVIGSDGEFSYLYGTNT